ncbi:hypothetical protein HUN59_14730 [Curtobacterium sp. Csp2]|uniref:hypothetical protein n=1 Tax=Curtobacterium sp. Csp2 TaxID=2495430 RepID=UPI001580C0D2|nr:hypothetical protein [Curtobacterium sp. Csp2]QKS17296.1 hypothetical protein HUN59_14730 [Curtobacterium sp. Csp2]
MIRTTITTLQWWLLCTLIVLSGGAYHLVEKHFGGWWWLLVVTIADGLVLVILRARFEEPWEARERRIEAAKRRASRSFWRGARRLARAQGRKR